MNMFDFISKNLLMIKEYHPNNLFLTFVIVFIVNAAKGATQRLSIDAHDGNIS